MPTFWLSITLALAAAGCGMATPATPRDCTRASDCPAGTTCIARSCAAAQTCASSRTCPGLVCSTTLHVCVECNTSTDCASDATCSEGVCVTAGPCRSDRDCSSMGLVCETGGTTCVECNGDDDCTPPRVCSSAHACIASASDGGGDAEMDAGTLGDGGDRDAFVEPDAIEIDARAPDANCPGDLASCDGVCVDLQTDPQHCATCGNACGAPFRCESAMCVCASGMTSCNSTCVDTTSDRAHCGGCNQPCGAGHVCRGSMCVPGALYHGWTSPLPGCDTSTYDTTAATVLGGSYPYLASDSLACRAWKLAATVCTTQPVPYGNTPAGDFTCPVSGGFDDPLFGTFCMPPTTGPQYACSDCYAACNAGTCFAAAPLSLRNCAGVETGQP